METFRVDAEAYPGDLQLRSVAAGAVTEAVVRLAGVSKRFGAVSALEDVSLDIPAGHFVTLLGPSGCGKSTLLRILAGFEAPTSGTVEIDGRDVRRVPPERRPVNLIFQRYALFPHRNVLDNVLFGLEAAGVPRAERLERAREALRTCRVEALESRRVDELSGGQAQRVAVARALVNRPRILLLDEPLAALDLKLRRELQVELRRLQQELGMTFLYVTHDQGEALAMSDAIVLMHDGQVVQASAPRTLYDAPETVFAATFIGDANVLDCVVSGVSEGHVDVTVGSATVSAATRHSLEPGAPAKLCLRPERISLNPSGDQANALPCVIANVAFEGSAIRYWLSVAGIDKLLVAQVAAGPGTPLYEIGTRVSAGWESESALVLTH
jgi:ABC-type Fe3+/spermidine/putrescine transport system ATPase subunit